MSEFSVHSGDPELEFDLYDYNLDNVVAGQPGSMFTQPFYYYDVDATPTADLQLAELFPPDCNDDDDDSVAVGDDANAVRYRKNNVNNSSMLRSRTSDLTASVTSADFVGYDNTTEEEDVEHSETDGLLGGNKMSLRNNGGHNNNRGGTLLNLTHIDDDDISFADSSDDNGGAGSSSKMGEMQQQQQPVCRNLRC